MNEWLCKRTGGGFQSKSNICQQQDLDRGQVCPWLQCAINWPRFSCIDFTTFGNQFGPMTCKTLRSQRITDSVQMHPLANPGVYEVRWLGRFSTDDRRRLQQVSFLKMINEGAFVVSKCSFVHRIRMLTIRTKVWMKGSTCWYEIIHILAFVAFRKLTVSLCEYVS